MSCQYTYSVFFGKCKKVGISKGRLILGFMLNNGLLFFLTTYNWEILLSISLNLPNDLEKIEYKYLKNHSKVEIY